MTVYAESNLLLELCFEQSGSGAAQRILAAAEGSAISLVIPSFCYGAMLMRVHRLWQEPQAVQRDLRHVVGKPHRSAGGEAVRLAQDELFRRLSEADTRRMRLQDGGFGSTTASVARTICASSGATLPHSVKQRETKLRVGTMPESSIFIALLLE